MTENETQSNSEVADRMRFWGIVLLVLGLVGSFGLTDLVTEFEVNSQGVWALVRFVGKVAVFFGFPLSAALLVGGVIVRRLR
jgi:hypothetical protein